MKSLLAASPALLLAGALVSAPAVAQTMAQPMQPTKNQPMATQPLAQSYSGDAASPRQGGQAVLPQGAYLSTCKEARMLEDTLTAFCSKGDGTWQTTQLWHADRCNGGVENAGGQLVCAMAPQIGSSTPPQSYRSSYGGAYGATVPATGAYTPAYAPPPSPTYAPPAYAPPGYSYNGYGNATTSWPNAYGTPSYGAYGAIPSQNR